MKRTTRKLALARETLQPLQSDALVTVAGGNARTLTWTCDTTGGGQTKFFCVPPPPAQ